MSAFQTAAFYELLGNSAGRLEREGDFLLGALARAPMNRVADLACGLGLHAQFLADHGAEVCATDLSPEMIRHAQETRAHPRIQYVVRDMRETDGGPYGLILCLGNSLSLLTDTTDLQRFFTAASTALAPGGLLVTQTLNYDAEAMKRPRIRVERASVDDGDIAAVKRFLPGAESTLLSITYYAATRTAFMDTTETVRLRHWTTQALIDAAERAGLTADALFGGFDKSPFAKDATDIVFTAQKPT